VAPWWNILIDAEEVRSLIEKALGSPDELKTLSAADPALVTTLPRWVSRFGILAGTDGLWLWCEPRADVQVGFPSQFVLDLPAGRYQVDTMDVTSRGWISRESAQGGPLVGGLPFTCHPVLVWVHDADRVR